MVSFDVEYILGNLSFVCLLAMVIWYWAKAIFSITPAFNFVGTFGIAAANISLAGLLVSRWLISGHFPLSNLYESLLFLSWGFTAFHLILERISGADFVGIITSPIALLTNAFASFSLPQEMQKTTALIPALQSNWLMMHVTVMMISYVALISGSLLSVAFLVINYYDTKKRQPATLGSNSQGVRGPEAAPPEAAWGGPAPPSLKRRVAGLPVALAKASEGATGRPPAIRLQSPEAGGDLFGVPGQQGGLPLGTQKQKPHPTPWKVVLPIELRFPPSIDGPWPAKGIPFAEATGAKAPVRSYQDPLLPRSPGLAVVGGAASGRSMEPLSNVSTVSTPSQLPESSLGKGNCLEELTGLSPFGQALDNLSYRTLGLGFPLLTIGILSGAVWANEAWGSYWSWDPKETWAFITWLVFAIYLHTRLSKGWRGNRPAAIAAIGFFVVWICYLGVNLLGSGLHSYGWLQSKG